jgi:hypothetical protein
MKNYLILLLFLILGGCVGERYNNFQKDYQAKGYKYFSLSCRAIDPTHTEYGCAPAASAYSQEEANQTALNSCGNKYPDCIVSKEGNNWVYNQRQNQRTTTAGELDKYIGQCEYIGFKRNTEKMGECVLKISQTETKIVNNSGGSDNTLANLIILQESLKVLNPPVQPNRNIKCIFNKVGGIGGVNCF